MVVFRLTFILIILSNYAFICKSFYHNCKTVFGRSSTTYLLLKKKTFFGTSDGIHIYGKCLLYGFRGGYTYEYVCSWNLLLIKMIRIFL